MIEIFLVLITIVLVAALCLHHHALRKQILVLGKQDVDLIRKAAEHSIMASNTVNPIVALTEVTKAVQTVEDIHARYGPDTASDVTRIDTREMLSVLTTQRDKILQDVTSIHANMIPNHPMAEQAGFVGSAARDP